MAKDAEIDKQDEETGLLLQQETRFANVLESYGRRLDALEQRKDQRPGSSAVDLQAVEPVSPRRSGQFSSSPSTPMRDPQPNLLPELSEDPDRDAQEDHPFERMWDASKMSQKEVFDQDLLQSIYDKSFQKARNQGLLFGGTLLGILSMPFGPIGMASGFSAGALVGGVVGICVDRRKTTMNINKSEMEKKRLKSLVRWSEERLANETQENEMMMHLEMVVIEFKPIADIAYTSKNARKLLKLLDNWAARKSIMRSLWAYMDKVLINWKTTTRSSFLRSMLVLQTLAAVYNLTSRELDEQEELFLDRIERLLQNESVQYVISQQQLFKSEEADLVMESMIYADALSKHRAPPASKAPSDGVRTPPPELLGPEDSDEEPDTGRGVLLAMSDISSNAGSASGQDMPGRILKPAFFKSWEDFSDFDINFKHRLPITQSDFALLLAKESEGMKGWDMCIDRKDIKVAKTSTTDATGCIFIRAWGVLENVDLHVAFAMFYNCKNRMSWDRAFFSMEVLDSREGSEVLYSVLRIPAFTPRDYVQWRRVKILEDGSILISMRSAHYPKMPEKAGFLRAESYISGYVLRRYEEQGVTGTKLFLMTCTDVKGIIPKWVINFVAPKKPGEWITDLKKACLDYQAVHKDFSDLEQELLPFKEENPFDYEDGTSTFQPEVAKCSL
mmetsp:Transcript_36180/g.65645  ORF Transcript_36180/g.65645 Transcript_36180/m.65645 type:complete len:673 (+) Transcript_36180:71-2089(+)